MILLNNYVLVLLSAVLVGVLNYNNLGFLSWFGLVPFLNIIFKENNFFNLIKFGLFLGIGLSFDSCFWLATNIGTTPFSCFCYNDFNSFCFIIKYSYYYFNIWNSIRKFIPSFSFIFSHITWVICRVYL